MYHYIAHLVTFFRMAAGLLLAYLITIHAVVPALLVLSVAVFTDFYDGYIARRLNTESELGVFLDPLADKVLVLAGFIALWWQAVIAWWVVGVIIARDAALTVIRSLLLARGAPLHTLWLAKSKTVVQFGALYLLIIASAVVHGALFDTGVAERITIYHYAHLLGAVVAVLTALSGLIYLPQILRKLRS